MLNMFGEILHLIKFWAETKPDNIAIAAPEYPPLTYQALYYQIDYTRSALNAMGLGHDDTVAIVLPNGPEMAVAFLSIASSMIAAPLNPNYQFNEFDFYLSDLNAKALIIQSEVGSSARNAAKKLNIPLIELVPTKTGAGMFTLISIDFADRAKRRDGESNNIALILHTSGTTSKPKQVPLTQENLCSSAYHVCSALELTCADRCLNIMPLFHIHGLVAAMLASLAAGACVICSPGFYAPSFFELLEMFHPTWYTAVPTMHQAILGRATSHKEIIAKRPLRLIRSSSSPLPPQVLIKLEEVFKAPVIEAYGMTEASHQIASNPLPPQKSKAGSVGMAAGPEVAIMDENGNLLPKGKTGEIVICGPNVMVGYKNNPTANQNSFNKGWFRTGDLGCIDANGYIFIVGRLKEIINRGGEKISPREVDEVLLDHPGIAQAVTFGIPHDTLGEELAAAVVLHEGTSVTEEKIREFAATRLATFKVPSQVLILKEIPKGPSGKIQRLSLAKFLNLEQSLKKQEQSQIPFTAPRTPIEKMLMKIWTEVLDIERISIFDNFINLGGDSMLASKILSRIHDSLKVEISYFTFFELPTIASLATFIDNQYPKITVPFKEEAPG